MGTKKKLLAEVRERLVQLGENRPDYSVERSDDHDDAFGEILAAESMIAGIATVLLDDGRINSEGRVLVSHNYLSQGRYWSYSQYERTYDLSGAPDLLEYARCIQSLVEAIRSAVR